MVARCALCASHELGPDERKGPAKCQHERCEPDGSPKSRKRSNSTAPEKGDDEFALPVSDDKFRHDDRQSDGQIESARIKCQPQEEHEEPPVNLDGDYRRRMDKSLGATPQQGPRRFFDG